MTANRQLSQWTESNANVDSAEQPCVYVIAQQWTFNPSRQTIDKPCGAQVSLRKKNAEVLLCLLRANNQTVMTEQLYQQVWGQKIVSEGVIKRSICDLRQMFNDHDKALIVTVVKRGYRLTGTVNRQLKPIEQCSVPSPLIRLVATTGQDAPVADIQDRAANEFSQWRYTASGFVMAIMACFILFSVYDSSPQLTIVAKNDDPLFIGGLIDLVDDKRKVDELLANSLQKLETMSAENPKRLNLADDLIEGYFHIGSFDKAIAISKTTFADNHLLPTPK